MADNNDNPTNNAASPTNKSEEPATGPILKVKSPLIIEDNFTISPSELGEGIFEPQLNIGPDLQKKSMAESQAASMPSKFDGNLPAPEIKMEPVAKAEIIPTITNVQTERQPSNSPPESAKPEEKTEGEETKRLLLASPTSAKTSRNAPNEGKTAEETIKPANRKASDAGDKSKTGSKADNKSPSKKPSEEEKVDWKV